MNEAIQNTPQHAGDVVFEELVLIGANGNTLDLTPFMIEMNITEDIFSPCIYGNMLITDSSNIIEKLPIIGEEYLRVKVGSPGLNAPFYRTFRVYSITDRMIVLDDKTQGFILNFCSPEVFIDMLAKIQKTFSGTISDVAATIYQNYLQTARNIVIDDSGKLVDSPDDTTMTIVDETENMVKFTSPGWGALKCLSWLAAKSRSQEYKSSDYLFFESSRGFYFGSISGLMAGYKKSNTIAGKFYYKQSNIRDTIPVAVHGIQYNPPNLAREYTIVDSFTIVESFNTLKSSSSGAYTSQMFSLNLTTKKYKYTDYDYGSEFKKYTHTGKNPLFSTKQFRTPESFKISNIQQTGLYSGQANNVNETAPIVSQNRIAMLQGYTSLIAEIVVPGLTNFEVGSLIYFSHPKLGPKGTGDLSGSENEDEFLSGLYLVTGLRHKFSLKKHVMIMEIAKDSTDIEIK